MLILGLNSYHGDSSACLVSDGKIVAAAEEERFRRIKHWAGFPSEAIKYCLAEEGALLQDVDMVAVNSDPRASLLKKVGFTIRHKPSLGIIVDRLRNQGKRRSVKDDLEQGFPGQRLKAKVVRVEHHLAHLASAFLVCPFNDAAVASVDGFGDFASAAWGAGHGSEINIVDRVYFPHSLGVFYQALTQYLGFPYYGDEYKVMGLAPYGRPKMLAQMRQIVKARENGRFELDLRFFRHHRETIDYAWDGGSPHVGPLFSPELEDLLGPARRQDEPLEQKHHDVARSIQAMYEEAFFHLVNHLHERYRNPSLALAGGCAMNSVANGKIIRQSPFKRLYIQSAAGDAGGAIGAAIYAWHQTPQSKVSGAVPSASALAGDLVAGRTVMDHAYLGPESSEAEIASLLHTRADEINDAGCHIELIADEQDLCRRTAEAIASGGVIGWFQGRMEWGPRALGNRSILCDPRRSDMKDILNLKIKRREGFRPFAPSINKEYVPDWFEEDADVPFMMQVFQIREEKRSQIPAVTHVDGSGRLQTVYKSTNARYWALIDAFRTITGVPMVLNTSFNENEPVVCRAVEALECFLRTKMDVLVLGDYFVSRVSAKGDVNN